MKKNVESRMQIIQKRNHPLIQPIRDLQIRAERDRKDLFFVDGMRFVLRAFDSGAHFDRLVVAPAMLDGSVRNFRTIERLQRKGVPVSFVSNDVYKSIVTSEECHGIGAVVRHRVQPLWKTNLETGSCWLAVSSMRSPGNLGTIMRSAEAVSAGGIILVGNHVDPFHSAAVRASMGSIFRLRLVRTTVSELSRWSAENDCFLVGTSPDAKLDYRLVAYPSRTIVFVGDERKGLNAEEQNACSTLVSIPMADGLDSLNVAIATSVVLYEILNQRRPPQLEFGARATSRCGARLDAEQFVAT